MTATRSHRSRRRRTASPRSACCASRSASASLAHDELRKCGHRSRDIETDTLDVTPSAAADLGGATGGDNDHHGDVLRDAALKVGRIKIRPSCVARPLLLPILGAPPHSLGVEIWEYATGARVRRLDQPDDLRRQVPCAPAFL